MSLKEINKSELPRPCTAGTNGERRCGAAVESQTHTAAGPIKSRLTPALLRHLRISTPPVGE